jgi:ubiquinone/menaquinone biosynthesis C-methylase UbiE
MELKYTGERVIEDANSHQSPNYLRHMAAYRFAQTYVQGKSVLDCGSGSGYGAFFLIRNGAGQVVGVDVSDEAIQYAMGRYAFKNLEFKHADIAKLDFSDGAFDVVTSFQVIEHLQNPGTFLQQTRRVLKRPGVALISTPNKKTYSPNTPGPENPFHVREYYLDEYRKLLKPYFASVEIVGVGQSTRAEGLTRKLERAERLVKGSPLLAAVKKVVPKPIKRLLAPGRGQAIDSSDYTVSETNLDSCLDFIAICETA